MQNAFPQKIPHFECKKMPPNMLRGANILTKGGKLRFHVQGGDVK
jgi:hypothetical protein